MRHRWIVAVAACLVPAPSGGVVHAQPRALPFDAGWEVSGTSRLERYLGREALRLRTGSAYRRDATLRDGTIDFQLAVSGRRAFAFVSFRMASDGEYEEFYVRPHKSSLPDAAQYAPALRGEGQWQLFHGPGGTAAVELPRDRWIPVRVVVQGERAALFVGDTTRAVLVVPRLARETVEGFVGLSAFLPAGAAPEGELPVAFADVVVRPGHVPFDFSGVPAPAAAPPGSLVRWHVSPAFEPPPGAIASLPDTVVRGAGWTAIGADRDGRVLLHRHRGRVRPGERVAVLARVTLDAPGATRQRLNLGFSDEVTVFLNGEPLFSGDARYRFDYPRQDGVMSLQQATLYLPLSAGANELILAVADVFGGWGFVAQLEGAAGVRALEPPRTESTPP